MAYLNSLIGRGKPSPIKITIDQKQLENVECFSCLDGVINPGFPWQKQQEEGSFHQQIGRKLKKKLAKCYIWSIALFDNETWALRKDP